MFPTAYKLTTPNKIVSEIRRDTEKTYYKYPIGRKLYRHLKPRIFYKSLYYRGAFNILILQNSEMFVPLH